MDVIDNFDDEDKETCIIIFLMLFIQKSLKLIENSDDTKDAINIYFNTGLSYSKYCKQNAKNTESFDLNYYNYKHRYIPLLDYWASIIFEGNYRGESLKTYYKNEKKAIEESQKDSRKALFKLLNFYAMDKTIFVQTLEKTNEEFVSGNYLHPGELLHYANIMLIFADMKIIPESVDEIQNRVLKFLDDKKDQIIQESWSMISNSYGGYAYNFKVPKFQEIREEIKKLNDEKVLELIKSKIRKDIDSLGANSSEFCSNIRHDGKNEYFQQPILSYVDIDEFYNKLNTVSVDKQEYVLDSFRERYGQIYSNGQLFKEYISDYKNLKKLAEKYTNDNQDCMYNPQAYTKQHIAKGWRELVEYFEEKYPKLKSENQQDDSQENSPK